MNLTMTISMLIFRSTVIGVVSGGPGDGTRLGKSCAGGRTLFARIGYQELEWIKKFTKEITAKVLQKGYLSRNIFCTQKL